MIRNTLVISMMLAGTAAAQDAPPAPSAPAFVNLQRFDGISRAGLELTYYALERDNSGTLVVLDGYVQVVDAASGFGGYAQGPFTILSGDNDDTTQIGNLEVGGIYVPRLANPDLGAVLHAGLVLPTGAEGLDGLVTLVGQGVRPHDYALGAPRSTWLRVGASPTLRAGQLFARADVGLDINLGVSGSDQTIDPLVHLNLGVGADLGVVAVTGELSTVTSTDGDTNDANVSAAALAVRGSGPIQPYAALLVPLDDFFSDVYSVAIRVGAAATF